MKDIERRHVVIAALAGGGSVLLGLQACGGGGDDAGSGGGGLPPELSSCGNTIANNHNHAFTVAVSDLSATAAKVYGIQGTADHDHLVTLSTANLADLKAGRGVTVTSSSTNSATFGQHTHVVTISCS